MSRRAAIITLYGRYNYGNRLQNHAVSLILQSFGFCSDTLVYNPFSKRAKQKVKNLLHINNGPESYMAKERLNRFIEFDKEINTRKINLFKTVQDDYEIYAIGSDQIWFPGYSDLSFGLAEGVPSNKIITVSPSFGAGVEDENLEQRYSSAFQRIKHLSCREQSGAKYIKQLTGRDALVTIDPTLAIDTDVWRGKSNSSITPVEPYIFVYMLGKIDEDQKAVIQRAKKETGVSRVVLLGTLKDSSSTEPGPGEFISLIDNAQRVVTDSFHGAAFSAMLKTPLTILKRNENRDSFDRLNTLCQKLGIENANYNAQMDELPCLNDLYSGIDSRISYERNKLLEFVKISIQDATDFR